MLPPGARKPVWHTGNHCVFFVPWIYRKGIAAPFPALPIPPIIVLYARGRRDPHAAALRIRSPSHRPLPRSEEHTSELQSLMRNSYAVFCLTKTNKSNIKKSVYQKLDTND